MAHLAGMLWRHCDCGCNRRFTTQRNGKALCWRLTVATDAATDGSDIAPGAKLPAPVRAFHAKDMKRLLPSRIAGNPR